jgi:hypothetical protein
MAYKILFKKQGLSDEWARLLLVNPKLVRIALEACGMFPGESMTITEIYRTADMQRSYYPGNPGQLSVHQFWRGIDIRIAGVEHAKNIVSALNSRWAYGREGMKTALIHDIGLGNHMHLQTIDGGLAVP